MRNHGCFTAQDGTDIYWHAWLPEASPSAVVVIAHGAAEHGGRYGRLAEALTRIGCAVYAIDFRGHGRSGGRRGLIDRMQNAMNDLGTLMEQVRTAHPECSVFLLGHSMGGAIAVGHVLTSTLPRPAGLILSGPALSLQGVSAPLVLVARLLSMLLPALPLHQVDASAVSRDTAEIEAYRADPLAYTGKIPARTVVELVDLIGTLPQVYDRLTVPLLIMHGSDDRLIPVSGSQRLHADAGATDKTLHVYDGLYHEIFNELPADRSRVTEDLCDWLLARIDGSGEPQS